MARRPAGVPAPGTAARVLGPALTAAAFLLVLAGLAGAARGRVRLSSAPAGGASLDYRADLGRTLAGGLLWVAVVLAATSPGLWRPRAPGRWGTPLSLIRAGLAVLAGAAVVAAPLLALAAGASMDLTVSLFGFALGDLRVHANARWWIAIPAGALAGALVGTAVGLAAHLARRARGGRAARILEDARPTRSG